MSVPQLVHQKEWVAAGARLEDTSSCATVDAIARSIRSWRSLCDWTWLVIRTTGKSSVTGAIETRVRSNIVCYRFNPVLCKGHIVYLLDQRRA
jgi:hypothetical protein